MRISRLLLWMLFCVLAMPAAAQSRNFDQLQDAALAAYKARNYAEMETLLRESERLRPNHPRALYNLAAARALRGDAAGALALLGRLERMKLGYKVWEDADFAALKDKTEFQKLTEAFKRHLSPQGIATFAFSAGVADFMPEGIAYDRESGSWYLSSVRQRRVLRIDRNDQRETIVRSGQNGMLAALGMKIEPRTGRLWVASAGLPVMEDFDSDDRGRSGLFAFDKDSGRLRGKFLLPDDGKEHALGELIIATNSKLIYTTDSAEGRLYALDRSTKRFAPLTKPGELESPQGLTFAPGQRYIYIADYNRGLFRYDLAQSRLQPLPVREDVSVYGIDGLYYHEGSLVAIQNGVKPNRVVRIDLDEKADPPRVTGMQVLAANLPDFDEPTLGVLRNNGVFYFIANSHWNRVDRNNRLPPEDELSRPVVMRIDLEQRIDRPAGAPGPDS